MPKQQGLNLKQIYEKLNELSDDISVLNEAVQDIKRTKECQGLMNPYEFLPESKATFWDGYWSPSVVKVKS